MNPKTLKQIEKAQNLLFKRFGFMYQSSISFPGQIPLLGKLGIWLINRLGGKIVLKVVPK